MSTATPTSTVKTLRSSDGTVIHAEAVGNPRNPPVVFLHEVTLCSAVFDEVFYDRRLAEHLYLVRYDLRCHGRSGMAIHQDGQHPARHGEDFTAVVNAFGLRRPIVVAWASVRGTPAAIAGDICASSSHNPISGVVFIAPLPFLDPRLPRSATERMLGLTQQLRSSQDTVITARQDEEHLFWPQEARAAWRLWKAENGLGDVRRVEALTALINIAYIHGSGLAAILGLVWGALGAHVHGLLAVLASFHLSSSLDAHRLCSSVTYCGLAHRIRNHHISASASAARLSILAVMRLKCDCLRSKRRQASVGQTIEKSEGLYHAWARLMGRIGPHRRSCMNLKIYQNGEGTCSGLADSPLPPTTTSLSSFVAIDSLDTLQRPPKRVFGSALGEGTEEGTNSGALPRSQASGIQLAVQPPARLPRNPFHTFFPP
ncbi:hypothetical protein NUW54_g12873 [Trametes sanguinea]|uniref:Uncharacterized protein n=1 Tax=Trametes sanguinea TaxID=158606 RepID=A0ACC1MU91_9APHY|nr:hypothetical protein NUW54_g12873 [Trametes sanguinea]